MSGVEGANGSEAFVVPISILNVKICLQQQLPSGAQLIRRAISQKKNKALTKKKNYIQCMFS